jgi:hypothetical protein
MWGVMGEGVGEGTLVLGNPDQALQNIAMMNNR